MCEQTSCNFAHLSAGVTRKVIVDEEFVIDGADVRIPDQRLAITADRELPAFRWRGVVQGWDPRKRNRQDPTVGQVKVDMLLVEAYFVDERFGWKRIGAGWM